MGRRERILLLELLGWVERARVGLGDQREGGLEVGFGWEMSFILYLPHFLHIGNAGPGVKWKWKWKWDRFFRRDHSHSYLGPVP